VLCGTRGQLVGPWCAIDLDIVAGRACLRGGPPMPYVAGNSPPPIQQRIHERKSRSRGAAPTPVPTARSPSRGVQTAPVVTIGAALVVFVVVSYAFSKNYEILAEGRLLSYTEGEVVQVRFFDALTVYVARESRVLSDVVTTIALAMSRASRCSRLRR